MIRHVLLTVLLALAIGVPLGQVSQGRPFDPAVAWAATELHYVSVARGEPRRQAILAAIADFERANPGVKVVLTEVPLDQFFQKVAIALSSGSGIDVFDVDSPWIASYAYQGALMELDKYYTKEEWEDFTKVEQALATYKGKIVSAPMSSNSAGLFVNTELFKAAGIPIPGQNPDERLTWGKVLELARNVMAGKQDVWGLAFSQFDRPFAMLPLIQSNGAEVLSPDGTTVQGFLNSPAAIEAAKWYGDIHNVWKVTPREPIPNLFYTGKLAMFVSPSYEANTLKLYPDVHWILAPHPYFKEPVTPTGAYHVGVFSGTKQPELSVKLLKAYTDREAAKRNYKIMNYMPVRQSTFEAFPETFNVMPNKLFYWEMTHTAVARPRIPAYREYDDLLLQAFTSIRQGADPAKEMNAAVQKIDAQLRRYR